MRPAHKYGETKKRVRKLAIKWSSDQTQKLIAEVQMREGTWNVLSKEYRDRNIREALWQEIADSLELPRAEVSAKWNSLRCSFRAAVLKMGQAKSGKSDGEVTSQFTLYNALKFLEPMLQFNTSTISSQSFPSSAKSETQRPNTSAAKRRRVEPYDGHGEVLKRPATTKANSWDDIGKLVASNGRIWETENLPLSKQFKTDIYELVVRYQKKITEENPKLGNIGKWPDEKYIRLFELHKARPFLWNKNDPNYMDQLKTQQALEEIGNELGCSGNEAKLRFRSMKQLYQNATKNGCETHWRFAQKLSFLSDEIARCEAGKNINSEIKTEHDSGAGDIITPYENVSLLSSDITQSKSDDDMNPETNNDETLMEFPSECEVSEYSYSQPSCSEYLQVLLPMEEENHSDERHASLEEYVATNNNSAVFQAFANAVTKQLEGFPEEEAYQLMADIQSLLSQRKVTLIRKVNTTNYPMHGGSKIDSSRINLGYESNVSNNFIKQENVDLG